MWDDVHKPLEGTPERPDWEPDWDLLRAQMRRAYRSDAWIDAGLWALATLEEHLGRDWLERTWRQSGSLPAFLAYAAGHLTAHSEMLELALRLHLICACDGYADALRDLKGDLRPERLLHSTPQLETAASGHRLGWTVQLEARSTSRAKPSDVRLENGREAIDVEVKALLPSDATRRHEHETGDALAQSMAMVSTHDPTPTEIPGSASGEDLLLRLSRTICAKADQAAQSQANWLRVDVLNGIWPLTAWGQRPLRSKLHGLATALRTSIGDRAGDVRGVVLCSAASLAAGPAVSRQLVDDDGVLGLRQSVAPHRVRECFVISLVPDVHADATTWLKLLDARGDWLEWALAEAELPCLQDITSARSPEQRSSSDC